jgi:hypothetical protein
VPIFTTLETFSFEFKNPFFNYKSIGSIFGLTRKKPPWFLPNFSLKICLVSFKKNVNNI